MSKFRTVEISNPAFEQQHLRFLTVKTASLKGRGDICIFVPPGITDLSDLPVCILLHGVYGSAWSWAFCAGIHLRAKEMMERKEIKPMLIAMPSDGLWGDGSAYLPHHQLDFEKWIATDVPEVLIESFPQVSEKSPFFIAGLSMGGFGALRIGAKYNERFKAMAGHSSITMLEQMKLFVEEDLQGYTQNDPTSENVLDTMLKYKDRLPPFRFDCGNTDLLIADNRLLHQQLQENNIPHLYEEFEGGHEWPYWEKHVIRTLQFFDAQMV
ncbi:alpha/beta hydrolase-fold protein [Chitinophaga sp. MM2321]|uniref:alpha/beta hydrolase n=1 Tax=Chitinophaga sp. MM2321 TaxID=3137178 RepID=UPI0032D5A32B